MKLNTAEVFYEKYFFSFTEKKYINNRLKGIQVVVLNILTGSCLKGTLAGEE